MVNISSQNLYLIWLVVQFHHLEKWWSSSMGLGWHPIDEMENKKCLKPPTILLFNGWSGTFISGNLHLEDMFMKHIVMVFMDHCTFWRKRWGMIYMVISNFLKSTWIHGAKYGNIHHIVNWNCPSRTQYWIYIYITHYFQEQS